MNILQIHNLYREKGGEDAVVDAERELLTGSGHTVYSHIAENNGTLSQLLLRRKLYFDSLKKLVGENKIDVAHVHNIYQVVGNDIYLFLKNNNIPIVQTLHNYRFLCTNALFLDNNHEICQNCTTKGFIHGIKKKCYRDSYSQSAYMTWQVKNARKLALQHVDKFIAVSDFVKKKYIEGGFPEKRIVVKHNHINIIKKTENETRVGDYALYIGRLSIEKGLTTLIEAFNSIDFPLRIAGSGPMEEKLKSMVNNSNISFEGFVDGEKKAELFRNAAFVIVPSEWHEPFGLIVKEAHYYSRKVIVSDMGALPELVHKNDLVFEASNIQDLKENVKRMICESKKISSLQYNNSLQNDLIEIYDSVRKLKKLL